MDQSRLSYDMPLTNKKHEFEEQNYEQSTVASSSRLSDAQGRNLPLLPSLYPHSKNIPLDPSEIETSSEASDQEDTGGESMRLDASGEGEGGPGEVRGADCETDDEIEGQEDYYNDNRNNKDFGDKNILINDADNDDNDENDDDENDENDENDDGVVAMARHVYDANADVDTEDEDESEGVGGMSGDEQEEGVEDEDNDSEGDEGDGNDSDDENNNDSENNEDEEKDEGDSGDEEQDKGGEIISDNNSDSDNDSVDERHQFY
jgi:hypothetical protein